MKEPRDTRLTDESCKALYEGDFVTFDVIGDDYLDSEFNQSGKISFDELERIWFGDWDSRYCINIRKI